MKIDLTNAANAKSISSVRSQITDRNNLKQFDDFLASHKSFDFDNSSDIDAVKKSGNSGEITFSVTIKPNT
jgi:hypothetical protein